jgi:hypothetical protein
MPRIAQDPIQRDSLAPLLARLGQEPRWYALIDTAFDYEEGKSYPLPQGSLNCYAESMLLGSLAPAAPVLVPLGGSGVDIQALLAHCDGRPMLSFLRLAEGVNNATELVEQWDSLHWVSTPDGSRYLLRFADTRVLACLPKILTLPQYAAWHVNVAEWHFINREGMLRKLVLPQDIGKPIVPIEPARAMHKLPPKKIVPAKKISFDNEHFAIAVDCGESDAMLNYINTSRPEAIPGDISGSAYYKFSEAALALARKAKIESFPDKLYIVARTVRTYGAFLDLSGLESFLIGKTWTPDTLYEAFEKEQWTLRTKENS